MALMRVNPTRMELNGLKKRLKVARRGHKLLKDKRDELMKKFLDIIRKNKELRDDVEKIFKDIYRDFGYASSILEANSLECALMFPNRTLSIQMNTLNLMSVEVPQFKLMTDDNPGYNIDNIHQYSLFETSSELDDAMLNIKSVFPKMIELAEVEKTVQLLAEEIEKTRRRVNALEYVMIPQLTETIKYITMKLDESERGNLTRLMKVKDMMIEQTIKANRKE
jgi:V/A-type H+-transporting ATPase subunit D